MHHLKDFRTRFWLKQIWAFIGAVCLFWTVLLAASLAWNLFEQQKVLENNALIMAKTAFQKDLLYRSWNSGHGGVYVPVTDTTQPNPYLADHPAQNLLTTGGKAYTLINPAYMTRQVFELQKDYMGILGHITSLNPIRPENTADAWEQKALQSFEQGAKEYYSVEQLHQAAYFRYMSPLMVEERCLACHAKQGYQVGMVRGGISESVPLAPLQAANQSFTTTIVFWHFTIWIAGLAGLLFLSNRLRSSLSRQIVAEKKLVEMSTFDALTGVYTRGYFEETLKHITQLKSAPISFLSADVDDLKKVNDQFGHEAGDRLLVRAASLLRQSFRETDFVSRTGGDEFIIILPNTSSDQAEQALERVRGLLVRWNQDHPGEPVHISLGIATTDQETDITDALKLADQRMYSDKAAHKRTSSKSM